MIMLEVVWMSVDVMVQWLGDPFLLFPTMCVFHRAELNSSRHSRELLISNSLIITSLRKKHAKKKIKVKCFF